MNSLSIISVAIDLFGAAISLVILFFLFAGDNRRIKLNRYFAYIVICTIAILLIDAVSWTLDGTAAPYSRILTKTASFFGYVFMYLIIGAFTLYLKAFIETKGPASARLIRLTLGICVLSVFTVVLSLFNGMYYWIDESNHYHRGELYLLSQVLVFIGLAMNAVIVLAHRKTLTRKEFISFLSYLALPVVLNIFHIYTYEMSWSCVAITLAVVIIYAGIQSEQAKQLVEQELELQESKIAIMISQIQPHFLYNALNTIGDLCVTDPPLAQETVFEFADYLRINMDSLGNSNLVPFEKELDHVKTYLALEQKRFCDRLNVEYDIQVCDFHLPPLTVQPIVENAVLHGVTTRRSTGTVLIRTRETAAGAEITVADDGAGFDISARLDCDKTHLGIDNVRRRLGTMCGGSLTVDSAPGRGTTVTILIPREERWRK